MSAERIRLSFGRGGSSRTEARLLFAPLSCGEPRPVLEGTESGLVVALDKLVYRDTDRASASLRVVSGVLDAVDATLFLASSQTRDVETLSLRRVATGDYQPVGTVPVRVDATATAVPGDGVLTLRPGEVFTALYYPDYALHPEITGRASVVLDFAIAATTTGIPLAPIVAPEIAMTDDDLGTSTSAPKPVATLFAVDGLPLQIPTDEVIFYPGGDAAKLARFLAVSRGTVVAQDPSVAEAGGALAESYLVAVDASAFRVEDLPQLQSLVGHTAQLYASDPAVLKLVGLALALRLDGFAVALNPRLQYAAPPQITENPPCALPPPQGSACPATAGLPASDPTTCFDNTANDLPVTDVAFGGDSTMRLNQVWPLLSLLDADTVPINVAFLDMGFAATADFAPVRQCDMTERAVACGGTAAEGPPSVGNSLFGDRSYHGNMVVTAAGARVDDGFGTHGIGGQVVRPMLYKYDLWAYAFDIGRGVVQAVDDGASVVSISAGFPCRLVTSLGLDLGICAPLDRLATCALLATAISATLWAVCAATSFIPFVGAIACTVAAVATTLAAGTCVSSLLAGNVRSAMTRGLAHAAARGVPVVTIAGNRIRPENLPPVIRDLVDVNNLDAARWEVIPCVLDGAICVGSVDATPTPPVAGFPNRHFNGAAVDIWAPSPNQIYAPCDVDDVASPIVRIIGGDSATSGAGAYVAGTIATMMAADPELDPRRATGAVTRIPGAVLRDLLESAGPPNPAGLRGARGPLINPSDALRLTSGAGIFVDLGYPGPDPMERNRGYLDLDEVMSDPSDSAPGTELTLLSAPVTGTVLALGLTSAAFYSADADFFNVTTPTAAGLYDVTITVTSPLNGPLRGAPRFDPPLLIGDGFPSTPESVTSSPLETTQSYTRTGIFNGTLVQFRLSASPTRRGDNDNFYKVAFSRVVRTGDVPPADRFDLDNSSNPPESRPNNNIPERGAIVGIRDDFAELTWTSTENFLRLLSTLSVPALNFGNPSDSVDSMGLRTTEPDRADNFVVILPDYVSTDNDCCLRDSLEVVATDDVFVELHTQCNGDSFRLLASGTGRASIPFGVPSIPGPTGRCIGIRITPLVFDTPIAYELRITSDIPGESCTIGPCV